MVIGIINLVAGILGFVAILWLVWIAFRGDPARVAEDDARTYYDVHGRWPDD